MKFRIKDIKNYIEVPKKEKINWKEISEVLNLKSFECSFEKDVLNVEILSNRYSDAASLIGIAKEIALIKGWKLKEPKIKIKKSEKKIEDFVKVNIKSPLCTNYFGGVILNVKNTNSPKWLKEFVEFYGFNSVNLLVDLSNFVMIEYGAPLHIFDLDKIFGNFPKEINVRETKNNNEEFISLTGTKYLLPSKTLVISDKKKILALAGIQGSKEAEVTIETKNIFIEAGIFEPSKIFRESRDLNIFTEASYRFERKVIPIRAKLALERLMSLIQTFAGGEVVSNRIEYGEYKEENRVIVYFENIEKYTGMKINQNEVEKILKRLDCKILKRTNRYIYVSLPIDRQDLNIEEDVIEEVIRIYGLNEIKETLPQFYTHPKESEELEFQDLLRNIMIQAGFDEVLTYSFISNDDLSIIEKEKFLFNVGKQNVIRILNPVSQHYAFYRPFIFPNLLKIAKKNLRNFKEIRIFEIGKCGILQKDIKEITKLGFLISLPDANDALLEAKGLIRTLFEKLGLEAHIKNEQSQIIEPAGIIHLENEIQIGFLGLLNKEIGEKYDLEERVILGEIDLNLLMKNVKEERMYQPIPEFPAIIRDISLIISETVQIDYIEEYLQSLGGEILESVSLFDVFQIKINDEEKKSVTFRLVFRAKDRTLTNEEVNYVMQKIANKIVSELGVKIR